MAAWLDRFLYFLAVTAKPGIAGQSAGMTRRIRPAAEVVAQMVREAAELLERGLPGRVRAKA